MTAMIRELSFALTDLKEVAVVCQTCKTRVSIEPLAAGFVLRACPSCKTPYDSAVAGWMNSLLEALAGLAKAGDAVQLRVALEKAEG